MNIVKPTNRHIGRPLLDEQIATHNYSNLVTGKKKGEGWFVAGFEPGLVI